MKNVQPILVSIDCLVYNHEPYLRKCLEGFVMQQTTFRFVAIVHDDVSTDGSVAIIREYAEKYPDIILPIYESENRYSKKDGSLQTIMYETHKAIGAKYVAICEGDDYWTDPLKLQKQVDFMEAHDNYSICFHNRSILWEKTHKMEPADSNAGIPMKDGGMDYTISDYFLGSEIHGAGQPLTILYRLESFDVKWPQIYYGFRDTHYIYLLLRAGKGYFMNFDGGVYRKHSGGISSGITKVECCETCFVELELYKNNSDDKILEEYVCKTLLWVLDTYKYNHLYKKYVLAQIEILKTSRYLFFNVNGKHFRQLIKKCFLVKKY